MQVQVRFWQDGFIQEQVIVQDLKLNHYSLETDAKKKEELNIEYQLM